MEIKRKMYLLYHNNAKKKKKKSTTSLHWKSVCGNERKKPTNNRVPKFMYSSSTNDSNKTIDEAYRRTEVADVASLKWKIESQGRMVCWTHTACLSDCLTKMACFGFGLKEAAEAQHMNSKKLEKDRAMEFTTEEGFHIIAQSSSFQEVAQSGSLELKCSSNCKLNGHSREECRTSSTSSWNCNEYGKGQPSLKVLFHPPLSEGNHSRVSNKSSRDGHKIKSSEYKAAESSTRLSSLPNAESMQPVSHYFFRVDRRAHVSIFICFFQEVEDDGQRTKNPRNHPVKGKNETGSVNNDSEIGTSIVTRWASKYISILGGSECMPVLKKKCQQVQQIMNKKPEEQQGVKQRVKVPIWNLLIKKLMFCAKTRTKSTQIAEVHEKNYGAQGPKQYKYSAIETMTASFRHRIGEGGFSDVFKGVLPDGRPVAVKVLRESIDKEGGFINEVKCIGRAQHINIISLLGFCSEGPNRVLIYEYMPSGSLDKLIYKKPLGSQELYQIAIGIARGLEYLHSYDNRHILHLDIKPHNILLDENLCPKISDFGLSKVCAMGESTISLSCIRGTNGYIAPEIFYTILGRVSCKSDVYSYGKMILEMVGGRKNFDLGVKNSREIYYPQWVYEHLSSLEDRGEESSVSVVDETTRKMMLVGLWCIQMNPEERPSMSRVLQMLEGNIECLQMPPNPCPALHSEISSSFTRISCTYDESDLLR